LKVCVECNPDAVLAETLGFKEPIHAKGNAKVTRYVCENEGVVGLQDEEPNSIPPRMLARFTEVRREHDMRLMEWEGHRIVVLYPRLEEWILKTAERAQIDPEEMRFNLPRDPGRLKNVINKRLDNLRRLTEALADTERMRALREWLESAWTALGTAA
jgi:hypothetical protein